MDIKCLAHRHSSGHTSYIVMVIIDSLKKYSEAPTTGQLEFTIRMRQQSIPHPSAGPQRASQKCVHFYAFAKPSHGLRSEHDLFLSSCFPSLCSFVFLAPIPSIFPSLILFFHFHQIPP